MKASKVLKITANDFKRLIEGKHVCINRVHRFIRIKCINIDTEEELFADVTQVGGIFTYSAAIRKID